MARIPAKVTIVTGTSTAALIKAAVARRTVEQAERAPERAFQGSADPGEPAIDAVTGVIDKGIVGEG